ncbi:MAG: response regulator, partial [Thaumarchaeota archaeon]|nr:response regulator [Nitrososphaerota archaeon]
MKILIIDDEVGILNALKFSLNQFGHDAVLANDGQEGLDHYIQTPHSFHLIITDLRMPNLDGVELVRALASKGFKTPIILMTGHSDQYENLDIGHFGLLYKPFEMEKLL